MKSKSIIIVLVIGIVIVTGILLFQKTNAPKLAYVKSNDVYNAFELKKELSAKLETVQNKRKAILDSLLIPLKMLAAQLKQNNDEKQYMQFQLQQQNYLERKQEFEEDNQRLTDEYSSQIWKQINQYIADYGKEKGYAFIYGATGDGSLMFAGEHYEITTEVSNYVNEKYSGERK
jgi:outer membrane protein